MKKTKYFSAALTGLFFIQSLFIYALAENTDEKEKYLIPCGQSIGVTLCTDGVLVTGTSELVSDFGISSSPAEEAGIKSGDIITEIDSKKVSDVKNFKDILKNSGEKSLSLTINRDGKRFSTYLKPVKCAGSEIPCLGVWIKDAASGIGTLTFIDPETNTFAALGHGISNADTGAILPVESGSILKAQIIEVTKGQKGIPGELRGNFSETENILGTITENSKLGLFGKITGDLPLGTAFPIARRNEVCKGKAYLYTTISSNPPDKYEIEIIKFSSSDKESNKGMVIKITDERLLEKTGGIVQGMSGSPIIQNGKIVGAVTHVFVNDPTRGYGIFIENMLAEAEKIK